MTQAILEADCVGKSYGDRRVLTSASLRAVPGTVRALVGRNGSGKSTLLRIISGVLVPDTGDVRWERNALSRSRAEMARRGMFFLPDHDFLSRAFTVRRQFDWFANQFGSGVSADAAAAELAVENRIDQKPDELSGGELRRAEIACAFVRRPRIFIADEPYRGVSPLDAQHLTGAFRKLAAAGTAVIVTGHEVPTLMAAADHITWCTSGTTYELGAPDKALLHERFRTEYLGSTATRPR